MTDPSTPVWTGNLDTVAPGARSCHSVVAGDSFAFLDWWVVNNMLTVDVSDPSRPRPAGGCEIFNPAEDMVLRDSFLYVAEDYRFQVVNVARPREPEVIGTLRLPERSRELILDDTLAYVANLYSAIVVNVARPTAPDTVGSWAGRVNGIDLEDTVLYVVAPETLWALSVADPQQPRVISFVPVQRYMHDVVVVDTVAYCVGWSVQTVSVADPATMRAIGESWSPVNWVRRVLYEPPHLYFCCTAGGVCIMETLQTGISESRSVAQRASVLKAVPSVTASEVCLVLPVGVGEEWSMYDAAGREVGLARLGAVVRESSGQVRIDLSDLPAGVYIIRVKIGSRAFTTRVVRAGRR